MKKICYLFLIFLLGSSTLTYSNSAQPIDILKKNIDDGISVLRDNQYKTDEQKDIQRKKMWDIIKQVFDFTEISKRALGVNWKSFTESQQKEFTGLFAELLKNNYIQKVQGAYNDEQVVYLNQDISAEDKVIVKTKIVRKDKEIPVDYSMIKQKENWKIYDIHVEGISLIKNYRSQFKDILSKETPNQLIERLKQKNMKKEK